MAGDGGAPELSVVVPVYNEAGNLLPLAQEIGAALDGVCEYEIVFVDDGSSDSSPAELSNLLNSNFRMRVLRHKNRAGKSMALLTAFHAARGTWVQTLDGDGQNDPADVAKVWMQIHAPAPPADLGIVAGRRKRRNDGAIKWLSSRIANGVRRFMLKDDTADTGCGFKLIRRDIAVRLPYFDGMHRFLPALVRRTGHNVMQVMVEDRPRTAGVSKYGFFGRLTAGIFDLMGVFWLVRRSHKVTFEEIERQKP